MTYTIENNTLVSTTKNIEYVGTTKKSGKMKPSYLVIHYTAGATFRNDVNTLSTSDVQASCQLVLSKDGKWAQIGELNDILWHAGKSQWKGINGMNKVAIGIEVCCEGMVDYLRTEADGVKVYKTWFGTELRSDKNQIIEAAHPNGGPVKGWVQFTPKQIEQLVEVGTLLMKHYGLKEAVGHDMISPGRKSDPGPCMPANVYSLLNGRKADEEDDDEPVVESTKKLKVTNSGKFGLNLRQWPSTESKILKTLKEGETVEYVRRKDEWFFVNTNGGLSGWAHSNYLK